jgi:ABC-2 type transport system permease protein
MAAEVQARELAVSGFMLFCAVFQPFFIGVTTMFMLRHRTDFDPMYVIVGTALTGLWSTILFSGSGAIGHERWIGTLELLAASPTSLFLVFGGKLLGTLMFSLVSLALSYGIGVLMFGYETTIADPLGFTVSMVFALAALWATGMFFAPLAILWRTVGRFLGALEYPVFALSGFLFPILLLPVWSLPVSYALPPYWAAAALHGAASGEMDVPSLAQAWIFLLVSCGMLLYVAKRLFEIVLVRARRAGTLALS